MRLIVPSLSDTQGGIPGYILPSGTQGGIPGYIPPIVHPGRHTGLYTHHCTPREAYRAIYTMLHTRGGIPGYIHHPEVYPRRHTGYIHHPGYTLGV